MIQVFLKNSNHYHYNFIGFHCSHKQFFGSNAVNITFFWYFAEMRLVMGGFSLD